MFPQAKASPSASVDELLASQSLLQLKEIEQKLTKASAAIKPSIPVLIPRESAATAAEREKAVATWSEEGKGLFEKLAQAPKDDAKQAKRLLVEGLARVTACKSPAALNQFAHDAGLVGLVGFSTSMLLEAMKEAAADLSAQIDAALLVNASDALVQAVYRLDVLTSDLFASELIAEYSPSEQKSFLETFAQLREPVLLQLQLTVEHVLSAEQRAAVAANVTSGER